MIAKRPTFSLLDTQELSQASVVEQELQILVAPELRGHENEYTVVRHEGDSDEDYASRCELFALVIEAAAKP